MNMNKVNWKVDGMTCSNCALTVQQYLAGEGMKDVKVNLMGGEVSFEIDGKRSETSETNFGIREITSELNAHGKRVFSINGKKFLIRGGGWSPDMMFRQSSQRLQDQLNYVQDMGLNTIRLEGKLETKEFFDLADKRGILIMAGWCCCSFWEHWPNWRPEDYGIAQQSLRDQIYRLRGHPSLLVWLNGSDNPPPPDVEQMYLKVEKDLMWPNPVISSATGKPTTVTGESGCTASRWFAFGTRTSDRGLPGIAPLSAA
jgi:exo-1,4-beta-D-glucosaminidase